MFSTPIEILIRLSVMPRVARISAGIEAWVIKAGHCAKLYTPPRDSARIKILRAFRNLETCGLSPFTLKLIIPPKPLICFLAIS